MSTSKFIMAQKLNKVQVRLMSRDIEEYTLQSLIPLIFKECLEENLTFWFNVYENEVVLNLRDTGHENYELNIRHYIGKIVDADKVKISLLKNTFLLTSEAHSLNEASSNTLKNNEDEVNNTLISSEKLPPTPINKAIAQIQNKGLSINPSTIKNHVKWSQLSNNERIQCKNYINNMEGAS